MASAVAWFKSSHSNDSTACVEVCFDGDRILVRDSKFAGVPGTSPVLAFTPTQWAAFTTAIRAAEIT
ncbi:DUF397 domain-containing protein [Streptomyces gardneri]|uniref:DUF397 domain-containing protein n=1 Tax=Nocardia TaxID=1817 RepID=UPI00135C4E61|nr:MULTISPECIES: DUF397 domain-containing protein [Nocardia]MBF6163900.1 DUF397 domain-containing protein [Streptomyces gardneri]MBF6203476.1 DUF397 domain-containing protein [Streptomyces gardneri]